jgi:hypothetical protein
MRHKWDAGEMLYGEIVSTCTVCGGVRVRKRKAGLDYINAGLIGLDFTGRTNRGWQLQDTQRSCPGEQEVQTNER